MAELEVACEGLEVLGFKVPVSGIGILAIGEETP
jgi:hypothetical protein